MSVAGGAGARIARAFKGPKLANYQPDYQSILNNDPAFQAIKQSVSAQGIQNQAQLGAATNQALINYGAVPDFAKIGAQMGLSPAELQQLEGQINPATASLAANNQFSTEKQLQRQEDQAMLALRNNLGARGALSSGEDAYQTGNQNYSYDQAQQSALTSLLGALSGYEQTYTTNQQTGQQQLDQALQQAEATDSGLPQYQGFQLHYNAHTGQYVGPSGETYIPTRQGKTWLLTDKGTGLRYVLNRNGTLTLKS